MTNTPHSRARRALLLLHHGLEQNESLRAASRDWYMDSARFAWPDPTRYVADLRSGLTEDPQPETYLADLSGDPVQDPGPETYLADLSGDPVQDPGPETYLAVGGDFERKTAPRPPLLDKPVQNLVSAQDSSLAKPAPVEAQSAGHEDAAPVRPGELIDERFRDYRFGDDDEFDPLLIATVLNDRSGPVVTPLERLELAQAISVAEEIPNLDSPTGHLIGRLIDSLFVVGEPEIDQRVPVLDPATRLRVIRALQIDPVPAMHWLGSGGAAPVPWMPGTVGNVQRMTFQIEAAVFHAGPPGHIQVNQDISDVIHQECTGDLARVEVDGQPDYATFIRTVLITKPDRLHLAYFETNLLDVTTWAGRGIWAAMDPKRDQDGDPIINNGVPLIEEVLTDSELDDVFVWFRNTTASASSKGLAYRIEETVGAETGPFEIDDGAIAVSEFAHHPIQPYVEVEITKTLFSSSDLDGAAPSDPARVAYGQAVAGFACVSGWGSATVAFLTNPLVTTPPN